MGKSLSLLRIAALVVLLCSLLGVSACTQPTPTAPPPAVATPSPTLTSPVPTSSPTQPIDTPTATQEPPPEPTVTPTASFTSTLRIGFLDPVEPLLPLGRVDAILPLLYDRLVYPALDNTYKPSLCRHWETPDGGETWLLQLEPGVRFSDGHELDAGDVVFTMQLFQDHPNYLRYAGQQDPIASIEATAAHTVTITMQRAVGSIERLLYWMPVLPEHVWGSREISATTALDVSTAIGTGPFVLTGLQSRRIDLAANRGYWMGAPKIDAVVLESFESGAALVQALSQGSVDLAHRVPREHMAALKDTEHVQVVTGPGLGSRWVLFNVSSESTSTGHPALRDENVRLAIAHAVDRQQIIDLAYGGAAMPGVGIVPPALRTWFNPSLENVPFDLQSARSILDAAAYTDFDNDGIREMPGSDIELAFRLFRLADSPAADREAELLSNWLRQIGIAVSTTVLDRASLESAACPTCDFDLLLADGVATHDPSHLLASFESASVPTGLNQSGYTSPAYDELQDKQLAAVDNEQRRLFVWQMQQSVLQDRPCLVLTYDVAAQAFRTDRFHNWLFVLNGTLSLADKRSLLQVEPVP